ncbi:MAG: hypothetical protein EXX96DRAFT_380604 [Benjaminiella poitrasii]|nr:MAG: hypothetical protein EXX96DRAFT_380604 [Benjaminiella poitrasii]
MPTEILPFVSVQSDWEEVAKEVSSNTISNGSFWIACYLKGKESMQGTVEVNRTKEHEVELKGNADIIVASLNSRAFKIECAELGISNITVCSAKQEFAPVKDKSVNCIDISPNGKLFAASNEAEVSIGSVTDGNVQVK